MPPSKDGLPPLPAGFADLLSAHAAGLKLSNMNSSGRWRFKKQGITVSFGHAALELLRRARSSPAGFPSDSLEAWIEIAQAAVGPGCLTTPDVLGAVGLELKNRAEQYDLRSFVVKQLATTQPMPGGGAHGPMHDVTNAQAPQDAGGLQAQLHAVLAAAATAALPATAPSPNARTTGIRCPVGTGVAANVTEAAQLHNPNAAAGGPGGMPLAWTGPAAQHLGQLLFPPPAAQVAFLPVLNALAQRQGLLLPQMQLPVEQLQQAQQPEGPAAGGAPLPRLPQPHAPPGEHRAASPTQNMGSPPLMASPQPQREQHLRPIPLSPAAHLAAAARLAAPLVRVTSPNRRPQHQQPRALPTPDDTADGVRGGSPLSPLLGPQQQQGQGQGQQQQQEHGRQEHPQVAEGAGTFTAFLQRQSPSPRHSPNPHPEPARQQQQLRPDQQQQQHESPPLQRNAAGEAALPQPLVPGVAPGGSGGLGAHGPAAVIPLIIGGVRLGRQPAQAAVNGAAAPANLEGRGGQQQPSGQQQQQQQDQQPPREQGHGRVAAAQAFDPDGQHTVAAWKVAYLQQAAELHAEAARSRGFEAECAATRARYAALAPLVAGLANSAGLLQAAYGTGSGTGSATGEGSGRGGAGGGPGAGVSGTVVLRALERVAGSALCGGGDVQVFRLVDEEGQGYFLPCDLIVVGGGELDEAQRGQRLNSVSGRLTRCKVYQTTAAGPLRAACKELMGTDAYIRGTKPIRILTFGTFAQLAQQTITPLDDQHRARSIDDVRGSLQWMLSGGALVGPAIQQCAWQQEAQRAAKRTAEEAGMEDTEGLE